MKLAGSPVPMALLVLFCSGPACSPELQFETADSIETGANLDSSVAAESRVDGSSLRLSSRFPYTFPDGVDFNSLFLFRKFHRVELVPTQAELRQHFYDPEPFVMSGIPNIDRILNDPTYAAKSIKWSPAKGRGPNVEFRLAIGENLMDRLNAAGAALPTPRSFTVEDVSEGCGSASGSPCDDPICRMSDDHDIVTGTSGCSVYFKETTLNEVTVRLAAVEPGLSGGRERMKWRLFDPSRLSRKDAANLLRKSTVHFIPILDEVFVRENLLDPERLAAATRIWRPQLAADALAEFTTAGSSSAAADAFLGTWRRRSVDDRFRRILPAYLARHIGSWSDGNATDCVLTALNTTLGGHYRSRTAILPQYSAADLPSAVSNVTSESDESARSWIQESWRTSVTRYIGVSSKTSMQNLFTVRAPVRTGTVLHLMQPSESGYPYHFPDHVALVVGAVVEKASDGTDEVVDLLVAEKYLDGVNPVHTELLSRMLVRVQDPSNPKRLLVLPYRFDGVMPTEELAIPEAGAQELGAAPLYGDFSTCALGGGAVSQRIDLTFRAPFVMTILRTDYGSLDCSGSPVGELNYSSGVYTFNGTTTGDASAGTSGTLNVVRTHPLALGQFASLSGTATIRGDAVEVLLKNSAGSTFLRQRLRRVPSPPLLSCLPEAPACAKALATP